MSITKKSGFTMIEMVIVIGLIAAILAWVVPGVWKALGQAKYKQTKTILNQIKADLLSYSQDVGRVPSEKEGLKVLYQPTGNPNWRGPYSTVEEDGDGNPLDGWKTAITYHAPPKVEKGKYKSFELISYGGENKTEDDSERKDWVIEGN